jgi:hypothetical protein
MTLSIASRFCFGTYISFCTLILFVLSVVSVQSQTSAKPTDGSTPLGLSPGAPAGSYGLSRIDNINLYNGSLNFRLPLLGIGGRGGAQHTVMLPVEQDWMVEKYTITYPECWPDGGCGQVTETHYYPENDWWQLLKPGYGPGVMHIRYGGYLKQTCQRTPTFSEDLYRMTLTRLTFTASDGTEYEFRDQQTGGQVSTVSACATSGASRGSVFVTADGTSATFISDTDIYDRYLMDTANPSNNISGYLIMRDGTRYRIDGGRVSWIRDRNGNKLTFTYGAGGVTAITDSLNRQVTIAYAVNEGGQYGVCDKITYKGFGGATRIIRISKTNLGNVLRAGYSLQTYWQLFPELEGSTSTNFNPTVVSDVWLPDDRRYQFRYNSHGELARVVLPTGGAIEYDHAMGLSNGWYTSGVIDLPESKHIYRRVIERREYPDGVNLSQKMTYSRPESCDTSCISVQTSGYTILEQQNAGGSLLAKQKHYFHGLGAANSILFQNPVQQTPLIDGREYQTEAFDYNGTTILRRLNHTWQTNGTLGNYAINPRIVETTTTLVDTNQVSKQTFAHDQYNNTTDVYEYDFGAGAAGSLIRRTHTDYLTMNPVNSTDYTTTAIHIRSLPTQTQVFDAGGNEKARTTFEYDDYSNTTNHAPLVNRVGISGFDSSFSTSYTTRGNVTKVTRWLLPSTQISAYSQYDIAGNIVKTIDPKGNQATLEYDDRFGSPNGDARANSSPTELATQSQTSFALATKATNALGHTAYTQFDYYLGRPVDGEDMNGIVSSGYYNDVLDRPTQIIRASNQSSPVKSQTSFSYDDANRIITTTSDFAAYNDNQLKSVVLYDMLGRTYETRGYETSTTYITSKQEFDELGRVKKSYNCRGSRHRGLKRLTTSWTV